MIARFPRRLALPLACLLLLYPGAAAADPWADIVRQGWTPGDVEGVPPLLRENVQLTLERPSLVRHFNPFLVRGDITTEHWLADHPPIAAAVGREMGIVPFVLMESWPNTYTINGGPVKQGQLHVLLRTDDRALLYLTGRVDSPLRRNARVYAVICARWWAVPERDSVQHDIFVYGRVRSRTVRVLAFLTRPISGPWITRRLRRWLDAGERVATGVYMEPERWARRMAGAPDSGPADKLDWDELLAARGLR